MTTPFSRALDRIYANDLFALDATYYPASGAAGQAVRVIRTRPDVSAGLAGAGRFRVAPASQGDVVALEVRQSEVTEPTRDGAFVFSGKAWPVREWEAIEDGLAWRVTLGKPADA
jgi:hypothetical protein